METNWMRNCEMNPPYVLEQLIYSDATIHFRCIAMPTNSIIWPRLMYLFTRRADAKCVSVAPNLYKIIPLCTILCWQRRNKNGDIFDTKKKSQLSSFHENGQAHTEVQMESVCHNNERSRYFWWFIAIWIRIQFSVAIFSLSFAQMMSLHWDYLWLVCVERVPLEFTAFTPISTLFILAVKWELNY